MVFSSIFFLFFFLPATLILYFSVGPKLRNLVLLLASLLFYAWGEVGYVMLMLFSISINWIFGLLINDSKSTPKRCKLFLTLGIILNLLPLAFFKYGNFLLDNLSYFDSGIIAGMLGDGQIHLPIGISFFTFQAISYIVDVYRNTADVQKQPINLALYISLFPQLIAGPIVRYHDVARQIVRRTVSLVDFQYGVQRFVLGLGKKVLIANNIGAVADHIYSLPVETLPAGLLWLGMLTYTLQIYYDFSAYSDMAIGLGRMFGFHFLENFNYPYSSRSIQEFWRRWHISLSSWFKDYLYIPLGGNRKRTGRTYFNLLTVFFLCGLWHGASWTFVLWGLFHGLFLVLERGAFGKVIGRLPGIVQHAYTILVVMIGWVFFRAESLEQALVYLKSLANFSASPYLDAKLFATMNAEFYIALFVGIIFSYPIVPRLFSHYSYRLEQAKVSTRLLIGSLTTAGTIVWISFIIIYSSAQLMSGSHNPFLYFRF
ncbi:MAG: alginate O-acetyltransferase [Desulfobulbaceae bacterium S3730MH12]|nr:MAG: alginate O-acetyltransferase [Desulfobulbaceae bacterium S3730MH12]